MMAAQDGNLLMVRYLLERKANPNIGKENGSTALFKACQEGHWHIVRMLIAACANLDAKFQSGCTPVGAAANQGRLECLRVMLAARADTEIVASDGNTALSMAQSSNFTDCVKLLQAQKHLQPPPVPAFGCGTRVHIRGLSAKPQLNGQRGTVLEYDGVSGRCSVQLFSSGGMLALKPTNLVAPEELQSPTSPPLITCAAPVHISELRDSLTAGNTEYFRELLARDEIDLETPFGAMQNQSALGGTSTLLICAASLMRPQHHQAGISGFEGVRALLEHGARVDGHSATGVTALMMWRPATGSST
jgi:hypothetical protein